MSSQAAYERVLRGVAGLLVVAQHQPCRPVQARDRPGRERREGVVVAGLCARDQVVVHSVVCSPATAVWPLYP